jgi:hypothetical protein
LWEEKGLKMKKNGWFKNHPRLVTGTMTGMQRRLHAAVEEVFQTQKDLYWPNLKACQWKAFQKWQGRRMRNLCRNSKLCPLPVKTYAYQPWGEFDLRTLESMGGRGPGKSQNLAPKPTHPEWPWC